MKNKVLKKVLAIFLAAVTLLCASSTVFSASAIDANDLIPERLANSIIITAAGTIPVVGSIAAKAFEPLLTKALGINVNVKILDKLDEISEKIDNITLETDRNTQSILQALYGANLNTFNDRITSLRTMVQSKYRRLKAIESGSDSVYKKEILTAELLEFNYDNKDDFAVLAESLAKYVNGNQITLVKNEGIYTFAYKANCASSVLGGEAAMKTAGYVNEVNEVLSDAYKLMMIVLTEKIYVYQNYSEIMKEAEVNEELAKTVSGTDMTVYGEKVNADDWNEILGDEKRGYIYDYNSMFDMESDNSAVGKYNKMIVENWYSYINSTRFGNLTATVEFIPLNSNICYTTVEACGLDRGAGRYACEEMANKTTACLNGKIHSVLSKSQLQNLFAHLSEEPLFFDENGNRLSLVDSLEKLGFNFDSWRNSVEYAEIESIRKMLEELNKKYGVEEDLSYFTFVPVFVYDASSEWKNVDNSTERYWDEKASYSAFDGWSTSADVMQTIMYYHYHEARGCNSEESGNAVLNALLYFTAA